GPGGGVVVVALGALPPPPSSPHPATIPSDSKLTADTKPNDNCFILPRTEPVAAHPRPHSIELLIVEIRLGGHPVKRRSVVYVADLGSDVDFVHDGAIGAELHELVGRRQRSEGVVVGQTLHIAHDDRVVHLLGANLVCGHGRLVDSELENTRRTLLQTRAVVEDQHARFVTLREVVVAMANLPRPSALKRGAHGVSAAELPKHVTVASDLYEHTRLAVADHVRVVFDLIADRVGMAVVDLLVNFADVAYDYFGRSVGV